MTRQTTIRLGLAVVILAALMSLLLWPKSDKALSQALVGRWIAVDPNNPALHKHEEGVEKEEIAIQAGGRLTYKIIPKTGTSSQPASSEGDPWGWRVQKKRLQLQDLGPESTQEWLPPLKFSVTGDRLSIYRRQFPAKEFTRVAD